MKIAGVDMRLLILAAAAAFALTGCDNDSSNGGDDDEEEPPVVQPLAQPTLGFIPPGESFDLANYTLTSRYDLPVGSGSNLLGAETSAVTYNKDSGTLFLVGDHGTAVYQVSKTGAFIDSMTLPADANGPQGTLIYDPEGIAWIGGNQFVLAEERYRQVSRITYTPNTTFPAASVQSVKLGTTIGNVGLEGITFDPPSNYILVKEKDPQGIFSTTLTFAAGSTGTASNGSATTVNSTNLFDPALLAVADLGDIYALSNVLPTAAADASHLLVLSQESGLLFKTDRTGRILSRINVGLPPQHEGVTMDENRLLYLANELGGGASRPQLWVYTPTTATSAVGTGSNVFLTFAVPVRAGTGSFTITGGSDTRTVAITDATQVSISGNTVRIDLTNELAPGTAYTVTAPAGLIAAVTGSSTSQALSTTFTTRVEAVPPTLVSSNPADNALGVTVSRVELTFSEPVRAGSGNIIITGTGDTVRTISVSDPTQVLFVGNRVDITPSADLRPGTAYNVQIASGVIQDIAGNPFAGLIGPAALNYTTATAGAPPPTELNPGEIAFIAVNGDATDAFAFVLLRAITAGTQIQFTDKDFSETILPATGTNFPANEAAFTWTAGVDYAAGTIITIQTDPLLTDKGSVAGTAGGISTSAETYYAFQGVITNASTGNLTVQRFLAAVNLGPAAGAIPASLTTANAVLSFPDTTPTATPNNNVRFNGSLDFSNPAAFTALIRNTANYDRRDGAGYPILSGSLFGMAAPPPVGGTVLNAGDVLFMGANADDTNPNATDAIAFVVLKDVFAGTQIMFTDNEYTIATSTFNSGEALFAWTADVAYPAGTIVTIKVDVTPLVASRGTVAGAGGGISTSAETYYAFQGDATGAVPADRFLAAINLGTSDSETPASLTAAGAFIRFNEDNAIYSGSLNRADLTAFATLVKNTANWTVNDITAFPLNGNSLFGGTVLAAGDVLFMAANADVPDAIAFVLLKAVVAGTQIGFTDKAFVAGAPFPDNESAFTWTANVGYPAGTIVSFAVDPAGDVPPTADLGDVYGKDGGISPNGETYFAFQGTIFNPAVAGSVFVDRFLAAISLQDTSTIIPPELIAAGAAISFTPENNVRYAGSLVRTDLNAFATLVKNPANWARNDGMPFQFTNNSLFPGANP